MKLEFPHVFYHRELAPNGRVIESEAEHAALGEGWGNIPVLTDKDRGLPSGSGFEPSPEIEAPKAEPVFVPAIFSAPQEEPSPGAIEELNPSQPEQVFTQAQEAIHQPKEEEPSRWFKKKGKGKK